MYYVIYSSAETGKTGCVQQFITQGSQTSAFPPMAEWDCPLCKMPHRFNYYRLIVADTPTMIKNLSEYCKENNIEMNVEIS